MTSQKERKRPQRSEVNKRLLADNRKAKELVGWSPKIDINTGLKKTIDWIRNNKKYYKADIYNI